MASRNDHVVVIGGGYGGSQLCTMLQKNKMSFTLIDARPFMHHNVAAVRAAVVPGFAKKTLIPLEPMFGANFKLGRVTSIDREAQNVQLEGGESVHYDTLVLATGSNGPFPNKLSEERLESVTRERYDRYAEKVKASRTIVLVGGGAAGVEIAAEISALYPDKDITLIHASDQLVRPGLAPKIQKRILDVLSGYKVKVILGEKVKDVQDIPESEACTIVTDKGTSIRADIVIKCTGLEINSTAYKDVLANVVVQNGALKVDKHFRVEGIDNIYAIGDCCNIGDPWMAYHAIEHAKFVFDNIKRNSKGSTLKEYKNPSRDKGGMIVVALGPHHAVGQMANGFSLPEFVIKKLKSADLMVGRFWGQMKQKPPT